MKYRSFLPFAIAVLLSHTALHAQMAAPRFKSCTGQEPQAKVDTEIDALIALMTPEERITQLGDRAPAVPRLGIPAYNWWNEGLHGIARNGYATVFPQAIGLAATWDPTLLRSIGETVSTEARAKFDPHASSGSLRYGGLTIWSPNINIFRDPRWGRGQETYGEDPFLTTTLGTEFVRGIQGDDVYYRRADATPKHFAAHSGPEEGRDSFNSVVSAHDLTDTYLAAFHALITIGGADAMMCSYNAINGTPSCANTGILTHRVREKWGFKGYIVSDCDAVGNLSSYQHYSSDAAHGAADALKAGVDLDCGNSYNALAQAQAQGLVSQKEIDQVLHRLLQAKLHLGMLQPASCSIYSLIRGAANDTAEHRTLARRAAEESIVLLHNDGILPLKPEARIALIGPTADSLKILGANYHGTASDPITPLKGLRKKFENVRYAEGSTLAESVTLPLPETALRTSPEENAPAGLHASFYTDGNLTGAPAAETRVSTVDLDLNRVGPLPSLRAKVYSDRWGGYFVPPAAGDYTLRVNIERCWDCKPDAHDGFRLKIGGNVLLDNHGEAKLDRVVYHAASTKPQPIELELRHTGADEGIVLEWLPPATALLDEAVAAAKDADVIVAMVGLSPDLEGEALSIKVPGFNDGDHTSLGLPAPQMELLSRLRSTGKPLVTVITSGSAVALPPDGFNAVLEAWYPGEEGGEALAEVLSGQVNPSGRMPVTVYRSVSDLPAFSDYSMQHRTYRYFNGPVLYPFGGGLSYSNFHYSEPTLSATKVEAGGKVQMNVTVTNTSNRVGDAIPELYITPPQAMPGAPRFALRSFTRITLQPKESRCITLPLSSEQLSFVDEEGHRAVREGSYRIFVGNGQPVEGVDGAEAVLEVEGTEATDF